MTTTTKKIVKEFPMLKAETLSNGDVSLKQESLNKFNDTERTFWKFAKFCEDPTNSHFDFQEAVQYIDKSFIPFFLECVHSFFSFDTYLLDNNSFQFIDKSERLLNQSDFSKFLLKYKNFHGINFNRQTISVYYNRGALPNADFVLNDIPYWYESSCQKYLNFISHDACYHCGSKNYRVLHSLDKSDDDIFIKCLNCDAYYSL